MKVVLLLVYIMSGDLVVSKSYYDNEAVCMKVAEERVIAATAKPGFEQGLLAVCVPNQKVQEVSK